MSPSPGTRGSTKTGPEIVPSRSQICGGTEGGRVPPRKAGDSHLSHRSPTPEVTAREGVSHLSHASPTPPGPRVPLVPHPYRGGTVGQDGKLELKTDYSRERE